MWDKLKELTECLDYEQVDIKFINVMFVLVVWS